MENRNNAIFEICGVARFTAQELRKNLDACIEKVIKIEMDEGNSEIKSCAREFFRNKDMLIAELKEYIARFLEDVDRKYPPYNGKYNKKGKRK